ncbi:MAG: sugar kinase [Anaerolineales bacterium]|nr:sugar kinase [Anaerolineales bacterium]
MPDVITFGETMIRLSPPDFQRLEQSSTLNISVGGSELTVAAGISRLGLKTEWTSRLSNNQLGRMVANKARELGVDTSHIVWTDDDRVGLYFIEYGASPRSSRVLYDRANSAISRIQPGEIEWEQIFKGAKLFHVSGITPALSDNAATVTKSALKAAKRSGLVVSYDLNYRARLWSQEKAREIQIPYMEYIDILITTEADTRCIFGIEGDDYKQVAVKLADSFGFKAITITLRETPSVWRNTWSAIAYSGGVLYDTATYDIEVVDRVGSGDNYTAGFLYGYLTDGVEKGVQIGAAFSALKQTSWGDFNWTTREEVDALIEGSGLRIVR